MLVHRYEFVWHASKSLPQAQSQIFTHVINGNYGCARVCRTSDAECLCLSDTTVFTHIAMLPRSDLMGDGYDWEYDDNPAVNASNVANLTAKFAAWAKARVTPFRGPLLAVWGSDFKFATASVQVRAPDALVYLATARTRGDRLTWIATCLGTRLHNTHSSATCPRS